MKLRLFAMLIIAALVLMACGDGGGTPVGTAAPTEEAAEPADISATEPEPEPTEPPPTEAPTEPPPPPTTREPFVPAENMSYWEQIEAELAHHGLSGGVPVFQGDNEEELMRRLSANGTRRTEIDVRGYGVPFSSAWTFAVQREAANFWEANASISVMRDLDTEIDDLIVGCVWMRGRRTAATDSHLEDDPPVVYFAIKTPTDDWASEGDATPRGEQFLQGGDEWQRVFFYARVMNDEVQSANMSFQIFMGYGLQEIDIGGLIAFKFPGGIENERAAIDLVGW